MYLFSRQARLGGGHIRDGLAWATAQGERVRRITGLPITLFTHAMSPQVGTLAWTTFIPDLATLATANDKLMTDDEFLDASDLGATFAPGGADDLIFQVVHGDPDPARDIQYVSAVTAVCAAGNATRGIEVGVLLAQMVTDVTGVPSMFLANATGNYGGVAWLTGFESIEALEAAQAALATNPDWVATIDREASTAYADEPSLTQQRIYRRVA